jgi:hypothetical protein
VRLSNFARFVHVRVREKFAEALDPEAHIRNPKPQA